MPIVSDVAQLGHSQIIDLFEIDQYTTPNQIFRFCNYNGVVFGGNVYNAVPFESEGWGFTGAGSGLPRPRLTVSNVLGSLASQVATYNDLIGARVKKIRTMVKYLDGQPTADFSQKFTEQLFYVDRKVKENNRTIEFELATKIDLEGVELPKRLIIAATCGWRYRSAECGYGGVPVAKNDDTPTADPALDDCSLRISGCRLRFGQFAKLPFGGFPGTESF